MSEFLVEVYTPRTEPASGTVEWLTGDGRQVHLLRSIFVPEDETCFYLFEGQSGEAVRDAATRSGLRVERVVAAVSGPGSPRRAVERQPAEKEGSSR